MADRMTALESKLESVTQEVENLHSTYAPPSNPRPCMKR